MDNDSKTKAQIHVNQLISGVFGVVTAALDVGAAVTRTAAQVTAHNKPMPEVDRKSGPISEMMYYGMVTATNVINLVLPGVSLGTQHKPTPSTEAKAPPEMPCIHRGATLRVPLSIENPGSEPMNDMCFVCRSLTSVPTGVGHPLGEDLVRFEPTTLTIAPKDFEKLTVFIDTQPDTAPGHYEATIGLGQGSFKMTLRFEVVV